MARGEKIEAIKHYRHYRAATGSGLREAKEIRGGSSTKEGSTLRPSRVSRRHRSAFALIDIGGVSTLYSRWY
jgi:hypothetical protein